MSFKPVYLSQFEQNTGLSTYFEAAFIPETAFPRIEDAYAFRGRLKRRRGFTFLGRLQRNLMAASMGNITKSGGAGVLNVNIFTLLGLLSTEPNAQLIPGNIANITITIGAQTLTDTLGTGTMSVTSGAITAATINYITGALALTYSGNSGPSAAAFTGSYYPMLPVMGIWQRQTVTANDENNIYFDTKYAYQFNAGFFAELPSSTPTIWNGADSDLFWATNYFYSGSVPLFWVTNFNNGTKAGTTPDPIYYYNNSTWTVFTPQVDSTMNPVLMWTCKILVPYKGRLLAFNTWEGVSDMTHDQSNAVNFPNRLRWSVDGDPTDQSTAWLSDVVGKGGDLDFPTTEAITSVEFIKDVLLVKFELSSWKLIFTNNAALPFLYEKINTELGCESTFSVVPFDSGVYAVGNYGITTDDSINVVRIDENIPEQVFDISNTNFGIQRVYGVRDYVNELVYWTYPDQATSTIFPNKVLVYNYRNAAWSTFNDSFTCYGYFQNVTTYTWQTLPYDTWDAWPGNWNGPLTQAGFPNVVAGNQQGFVLQLNDAPENDTSLAITALGQQGISNILQIKIPNHNLQVGQFIIISGIIGSGTTNPQFLNGNTYQVASIVNSDNITINDYTYDQVIYDPVGVYVSGGLVTVLNNINVWTKRFSFFFGEGKQTRFAWIDFYTEATEYGQFTANIYINENDYLPLNNPASDQFNEVDPISSANVVLTSPENSALYPFQLQSDKIWHRMYAYIIGQSFQVQITMSDAQMFGLPDVNGIPTAPGIPNEEITIYAFTPYVDANARLTP